MSSSAKAVCVPPRQVHLIWPEVEHWIKRAMERTDLGAFRCVESDVLQGRALLWVAWHGGEIKGAAVTQIALTEKSKVCTIVACGGGSSSQWLHLIGRIEAYAKGEGCDAVRILGRLGWLRVLKNYRAPMVMLERRL